MKTTNKFHLLLYTHFNKRYLDKLCIAYYMTEHSLKSMFCLKVSLKFNIFVQLRLLYHYDLSSFFFLLILFTQYILAEYKFKYANCHHHLHCVRNEIYYFYHFLFVETKEESLTTPALEEQNNINQKKLSFTGSHLTTPEVSYQP